MSSTLPRITARPVTTADRQDAKLNYIIRRLDEMPTRFHLMAVVAAAGGFWALVLALVILR